MTIACARHPARQLDIIADTVLAADPRLKIDGPKGQCFVNRSPKPDKDSASSTVPAIERRRKAAGLSHDELCRAAGIQVRNWYRLVRGDQQPTAATLKKLEAALAEMAQAKPPKVIAGFHRLVVCLLADAMKVDREAVFAADMSRQRPHDKAWMRASRIQMMATYITAVELEVGNAELGRALSLTRQAVQKARNRVEDLRDDAAIDTALVAVTAMVALA